ncbi:aminoglycoside phosphotransferase family protein [Pseudonocardia sp. DR1-2]|uniref:phosphotransferase enzyme family protein n=1 Tax=Pseudonocardia sp. DR1-2 TaxID=2951168 RepID=UPI0020448878|nr:aminoglycoside phosphotransferase family protein [Pseudonocardia sp. DR1-2]MCM3846315.1 aminoglycoside phosphotransferase family protein [Pseudonocardia sp. DR1-2]
MAGEPSSPTFGRESTLPVLREACRRAGLPADGAELLRLGENAIYRLAGAPVVVRIARSSRRWPDAVKEVRMSRWLAEQGVRVVRLASVDEQPFDVDGHPVTFWEYIDGRRGRPSDVGDLARILRSIHELPVEQAPELPAFDPFARVTHRIEQSPIPEDDRAFLAQTLDKVRVQLRELEFPLALTVMHGDAHVQNLMVRADGQPLVIDLENMAIGQPEWDLNVTATERQVAGFWTRQQYSEFVDAYGFDVTRWSGFDTLLRVQSIKMTTWLMQNINEGSEVRSEYERRMRTIRGQLTSGEWRPF